VKVSAVRQVFLVALLFRLAAPAWVFSAENEATDCLAYWQLRSVGLSRDYGIASAKLSDQFYQRYKTELSLLKEYQSPKVLVKGMFAAMTIMLEKIDNDYDRTAELDAGYAAACPL
jgi:hypothetical protein